jgi:hypothetical protein
MTLIQNVTSQWDAEQRLKAKKIKWDRNWRPGIKRPRPYGYGEYEDVGVHVYFMAGDCDVAYYTPLMNTLLIHDQPRGPWDKKLLDNRG